MSNPRRHWPRIAANAFFVAVLAFVGGVKFYESDPLIVVLSTLGVVGFMLSTAAEAWGADEQHRVDLANARDRKEIR